ncbi:MAG: AsmA family protein [Rhodospirillales bacterium]|nr:AsmA family protein [Rhodospirillales bacterium]
MQANGHRRSGERRGRGRFRTILRLMAAAPLVVASVGLGLGFATVAGFGVASLSRAKPADSARQCEKPGGDGEDLGATDALAAITQGTLRSFVEKLARNYTGREVSIGRLDVDLGLDVVEVRAGDVSLANANWGRSDKMLSLKALKVRVEVAPLLTGSIVVPLIDVDGARVVYAVNENGETNLPLPQGTKSEESKPFSLADLPLVREARVTDSSVTYRNAKTGVESELDLAKASFAAPEGAPIELAAEGTYGGEALRIDASGGTWRALSEGGGEAFPVDLRATLGALSASASGGIALPAQLQGVDLKVDLRAEEIPRVYPLDAIFKPPTPPLRVAGHLTSETGANGETRYTRYTLADLGASLDKSEITGSKLTVTMAGPRPRVEGQLRASRFRFDDLTSYFSSPKPEPKDAKGVLPQSSFWPLAAFQAVDADIDFDLAQFHGFGLFFDMLSGTATSEDGVFRFQPLHGTRGDAEMTTYVSVYSKASPVKTDVKAEVHRLNLARRVGDLPFASVPISGRLGGRANLGLKGNSIAAMAGTANGEMVFAIDEGQVSGLLLELLGLDIAESLGLVVTEDDEDTPVPIRCALGNLPVHEGTVDLKTFIVDTADTLIKAEGSIGLDTETLDLRVVPYPKDFSLLSMRSPIGIEGTFASPDIFTDPVGLGVETTADKVINAILTPIAGLLPPFDTGTAADSDCAKLVEQAGVSAK